MTFKNMFTKKNRLKGFSLVELLAVIAIIGVLSAVVMSSFSTARKQSRVSKRVSDMKQVQAALEFYYAANHSYPTTASGWRGVCSSFGGYTATNVIPGLAPTYIPTVPTDPQTASADHDCYIYKSDGIDWAFVDYNVSEMFWNQSAPNFTTYSELIDPARDGGSNASTVDGANITSWKVYSAGAASW